MSVGNLIAIMVKKKRTHNENNQTELNYENKTLYTRLGKLLKTIVLLGVILVICVKNQYYLLIDKKTWVIFPNWVSITFNQIHMIILLFVTDPNFKQNMRREEIMIQTLQFHGSVHVPGFRGK